MSGSTGPPHGGPSTRRFRTPRWNGWGWSPCHRCGRLWKPISPNGTGPLPGLRFDGVIAFARLGFEIFVGQLDVDFPVGPVLGVVGRGIPDGILATHFVL